MCRHNPCVLTKPAPTGGKIHFGTYVDDNLYFGTDDEMKSCFEKELDKQQLTID